MTAPRPGDPFHLDLGGTAIAGHYLEVDPPHRLVIGWDLPRSDKATPASAVVEITLTPTDDGTDVKVQLSGLSADDAAFHQQLWARHLDRIAAAFAGVRTRRTSWHLSHEPSPLRTSSAHRDARQVPEGASGSERLRRRMTPNVSNTVSNERRRTDRDLAGRDDIAPRAELHRCALGRTTLDWPTALYPPS